jgi:5-methylcytosine-specific restriction endonuclease McrA
MLHVDHIKPWSLGGLTVDENLQTLCEPCNLGKSNAL